MWAFLKNIQSNPIYLREQGRWGEPNPYYAALMRYLPLIIIAVLALGIFCGYGQLISPLLGIGEAASVIVLLVCIPNILVQILTWVGLIIAPALTAPAVVEEVNRGSWEILRLTPMPILDIIWAKLLGGLSRLRIWWALIILSVVYGLGTGIGTSLLIYETTDQIAVGWGLLTAIVAVSRPLLEIGFAGLTGLTVSLWTASARAALIATYALVLLSKLIFSTAAFWGGAAIMMAFSDEAKAFSTGSLAVNTMYVCFCVVLFFLLRRRTIAFDNGDVLLD
ncbi:MAG: hypothetical protein AAGD96_11595 [Chloroflexota bacterium]